LKSGFTQDITPKVEASTTTQLSCLKMAHKTLLMFIIQHNSSEHFVIYSSQKF
jgi:hypothetical protein